MDEYFMNEIALLIIKIIGGALATVFFYRLGFKILSKFGLIDGNKEYSRRAKYWISEVTQFLIVVVLLAAVILFNRYSRI